MKLAYTMAPGRGDTDLVLERLAADVAARGLRCRGTVYHPFGQPHEWATSVGLEGETKAYCI